MIIDPQRFNLYAYVENNPLSLSDPTGEAIELTGNEDQRKKQLEAAQNAVGSKAGAYLFENKVEKTDANGNKSTSYYIGVYQNGPDGKGPSFGSINNVAGAFADIINDSRVAVIDLVPSGKSVTDRSGDTDKIGPIPHTPGATYYGQDNRLHITLLDPSTSYGQLPPDYMSNWKPGNIDIGTGLAHEMGHVRYEWGGFWRHALDDSNSSAVRLENDARKVRDPKAPIRTKHSD
jgi:hypothetical protein